MFKARHNRDRWAHRRAIIEHNRRKQRRLDEAAELDIRLAVIRAQILNGGLVVADRPEADAELAARVGLRLVDGSRS